MDDIQSLYDIKQLAELMDDRKNGETPYLLILGAGASFSSGCSSGWKIVEDVLDKYHLLDSYRTQEPEELSDSAKLELFWDFLKARSQTARYTALRRHIEGEEPSIGYICLAELIQAGYFNIILTTNFDIFLERALQSIGMIYPRDFAVLVNGYQIEEHVLKSLNFPKPRVKVLKLHGDLYARIFQFRPNEIFEFTDKIQQTIEKLLEDDAIIVGHSMQDTDLNRCFHIEGGEIWYVNPNEPTADSAAGNLREIRETFMTLNGIAGYFDQFFIRLHYYLLRESQRIREQRAHFYYQSGRELYELSNSSSNPEDYLHWAIQDFRVAADLGFTEADVYYQIGQSYDKHPNSREYNEQAIEAYSWCLELNPNFKGVHRNRGRRYMEQELYDEAIKDFQLELSLNPGDSDARDWLLQARERKMLEYIYEQGRITNRDYRKLFEVSRSIATKELSLLVEANKLVRKGTGRGTYYILPEEGE
ncbi:TPA: hypothetical protein EYP66_24325 [Candidatus Poribacteria bacterium]|nr:hypothetical protein [Candidatus Poribacteria bacterium]